MVKTHWAVSHALGLQALVASRSAAARRTCRFGHTATGGLQIPVAGPDLAVTGLSGCSRYAAAEYVAALAGQTTFLASWSSAALQGYASTSGLVGTTLTPHHMAPIQPNLAVRLGRAAYRTLLRIAGTARLAVVGGQSRC